MKQRRQTYAVLSFFLIMTGLLSGLFGFALAYEGEITPGISLQGESLQGLTPQAATDYIKPLHANLTDQELTFQLGDYERKISLRDIGYTIDTEKSVAAAYAASRKQPLYQQLLAYVGLKKPKIIPVTASFDAQLLRTFLAQIKDESSKDAKDISLEYKDGKVQIVPPETGIAVDDEALFKSLAIRLNQEKISDVAIPYTAVKPRLVETSQVNEAQTYLSRLLSQPLKVEINDGATTIPAEITPDTLFSLVIYTVKDDLLEVTFDEGKVKEQIDALAKKVSINPAVKQVSSVDNATLIEGRDGRTLNRNQATATLLNYLKAGSFDAPVALAAEKIDRNVITEGPEYSLGRSEGKYIEIDISRQRMTLLEGMTYVRTYAVSTGKWSTPTPIGEFEIHNHVPTAWSKRYGLYMDNWMAITANGEYGIHQLPRWPSGFVEGTSHIGRPASHGCIRLAPGDARAVYDWADNGTKVFIHE